jgi:hypothetical protein
MGNMMQLDQTRVTNKYFENKPVGREDWKGKIEMDGSCRE